MNELLGKVIKSITHGFDSSYENIIKIETEHEFFHYKIVGPNRPLALASTINKVISCSCKECGAEEDEDIIDKYGICRKCVSGNLKSWEAAK